MELSREYSSRKSLGMTQANWDRSLADSLGTCTLARHWSFRSGRSRITSTCSRQAWRRGTPRHASVWSRARQTLSYELIIAIVYIKSRRFTAALGSWSLARLLAILDHDGLVSLFLGTLCEWLASRDVLLSSHLYARVILDVHLVQFDFIKCGLG